MIEQLKLLAWKIRNFPHLFRGLWREKAAEMAGIATPIGTLSLVVTKGDGRVIDYGVVSKRVVTTAGVNFLVDALQGTVEPEILRFHAFGTGSTAEAIGDTALVTELTTQYNPDNTRPQGSLGEGASANIFRTVATFTPDSGGAIVLREHGVLSQAATGGGTLLDRSVFAAITVDSATGDSVTATYDFTITAGS